MDEYQHAQMAWLMVQGRVPYRDFFEHHLPLLHLLAMPVLALFRPEDSFGRTLLTLITLRSAMLVPLALACWGVWHTTRRFSSALGAFVALALFAGSGVVVDKGVEFRPDVPAAALVVGALWAMLHPALSLSRRALYAGLLLGTAFGFTQKALFLFPGFALALLLELPRQTLAQGLRALGLAALGLVCVPVLIVLGFASIGAAGDLLHLNFAANAVWPVQRPVMGIVTDLMVSSPVTTLAGLVALFAAVRGPLQARQLALVTLAGITGLFVLPISYSHYVLIWLAAPCILAGFLCTRLPLRVNGALASMAIAQGILWTALHATSINYFEFRALEHMHTLTTPGTRVLSGWHQQFPFRPPALWRFYLNSEVCPALSADERSALLAALDDPAVKLTSPEIATCLADPRPAERLRANFVPVPGETHMLVRHPQ